MVKGENLLLNHDLMSLYPIVFQNSKRHCSLCSNFSLRRNMEDERSSKSASFARGTFFFHHRPSRSVGTKIQERRIIVSYTIINNNQYRQ